ncbi:Stealth CR1 domain-containing protein [Lachnospiraceae bacterium OttesenSCG-928-E19]|nr:Stealth CR1 domain-containing protein [Lachnospiraceae bacterium OttesenSCG-928-E19]
MEQRKIDLVYLWVDGNDQKWQLEKTKWQNIINKKQHIISDAIMPARWRDNDELRYSLRSIEKFAPWINHIYIVTGFGQIPNWLYTNHPKISIIDHAMIMPCEALPTFNSNAIEKCIANIPGLSEYFLLANDDMFFGRPLTPDFFFNDKGHPIVWFTKAHFSNNTTPYEKTLLHSAKTIQNVYKSDYSGIQPAHNIDPYRKSFILECNNHHVWNEQIKKDILNKFRTDNELQRWIYTLYNHANNKCVLKRTRNKKDKKHFIYNFIHKRKFINSPIYCIDAKNCKLNKINPPLFCINDTEKNTDKIRQNNLDFLESKFSKKSQFEL